MNLEDLLMFDGIVTVSGDGLPHEVVNAIFSRKDWYQASQVTLGTLPGGSGNALGAQLCTESRLQPDLDSAALLIIKGKKRQMDLIVFEREKNEKIYSFIGLLWGYLCDVDLESEVCFGGLRFDIYGVWRLLFLRHYTGKFYYSYDLENIPSIDESIPENTQGVFTGDILSLLIMNIKNLTDKITQSPESEIDDGQFNLQLIKCADNGRIPLAKYLLRSSNGSHITSSGQVKPGTRIDYKMLKFFRLEPENNVGYFSIDGERYNVGKIQGQILPKSLKVYCF